VSALEAEFTVERGRDFKSVIEVPALLSAFGGPGDPLSDRVRFALAESWRAVSLPDHLHDSPIRVRLSLRPDAFTLAITVDTEGVNDHD
jgi:hypothetical protein